MQCSDAELSVLAGAQRIEGTLFGNGERTGNVDLITLAMNLYTHGVDSKLDFSNIRSIKDKYERLTGMHVYERTPYAGDLVFTAFSGSHQDAISKGMTWWEEGKSKGRWTVPYLPVDPKDLGRQYESDVIRINSQSGKGGVSYILKQYYGLSIPYKMCEEVGYMMKGISDKQHKELKPEYIYRLFEDKFININSIFNIKECHYEQIDGIRANVIIAYGNDEISVVANGNGRLDAVSNAIKQYFGIDYELAIYEEHALTKGSTSKAVAYVGINSKDTVYWGVGIDEDIIKASTNALVSATNKLIEKRKISKPNEERIVQILNYIQDNYNSVTMDDLSKIFFLSKPYLSKYIKINTRKTFQEVVLNARMNKACTLIKNNNIKIETIAEKVGYQNVEHFNRVFKKIYKMTPTEYRNSNNIDIVRRGFEKSFKEEKYYKKQTKDDKHLELLLNMTQINKNDVILDLGTGSGYVGFALAAKNPESKVIGLDIVRETLKKNQDKADELKINNIKFIEYDGLNFPFEDDSIDVIYTRYAMHHFPDINKIFREIKRVLKPNGKVVIADPIPNENDKDRFVDEFMKIKKDGHVKFYSIKEYKNLAKTYGLKVNSEIITQIRFPRKEVEKSVELTKQYDKEVIDGYKVQVKGSEIFITENVINIVLEK